MKQYGAFKATEFTKKQINVIYGKAKAGELKIEKWVIKSFYDLADYYNYDSNRSVEEVETKVLDILNDVFAGNIESAQSKIDDYTKWNFDLRGRKFRENVDRNFL